MGVDEQQRSRGGPSGVLPSRELDPHAMRGHDSKLPSYHTMEVRELTHHLYMTTNDLLDAIDELVTSRKTETSTRVQAYFTSSSSTERGREMEGKRASMTATLSVIELEGLVQMLTDEKFLILKIIDLRLAGVL